MIIYIIERNEREREREREREKNVLFSISFLVIFSIYDVLKYRNGKQF